jgi:uncharacterized RDD family membrane protein YckC
MDGPVSTVHGGSPDGEGGHDVALTSVPPPLRKPSERPPQTRLWPGKELDRPRVLALLLDGLVLALPAGLLRAAAGPLWLPAVTALVLSYFFVCEAVWGQTVGKRRLGLRVVRVDGRRLSPTAVAPRTVLRLIDAAPVFYLIGGVTMLLSGRRRQRLGDLAAGTMVVRATSTNQPPKASGRGLLALVGYPLAWVGAAVAFAAFAPGAGLQTCSAAGIDAEHGNEGTCVKDHAGPDTGRILTVVDSGHPLRMPTFEARLRQSVTHPVTLPGGGSGFLVGYEIAVTNTTSQPLPFDLARDDVNLLVRNFEWNELPPAHGLEGFDRNDPISPGQTTIAWASFVVRADYRALLNARPSDLEFLLPGHPRGDVRVGHIRLWKAATTQGARALTYAPR